MPQEYAAVPDSGSAPPPNAQPGAIAAEESKIIRHPEPSPDHGAPPLSDGIRLLERAVYLVRIKGGSDIHFLEGEHPRVRIRGDLLPVEDKEHPLITRKDIEDILNFALTPAQKQTFEKNADIDFSLDFQGATGRVNVGLANGRKLYLTMRYLPSTIIPLDRLGIDAEMLKKLAETQDGLIIVAGETSSGKTTTIAAMLDYINHTRFGSITTIENPVEYVLHSNRCLITRREIGRDTPDFHNALRASVRKNPDVLLIGEIRDAETASIAMNAAETGIQTFCTLHAIGVIPAISRLGHILTGAEHDAAEFHLRLSEILAGIISQQLVKASDGAGIMPIYEILYMTYTERDYLRQGDVARLEQSLETDRNISRGKCVYRLWHQEPRRINEDIVRSLFGDQFNLMMNRLGDAEGWKPLVSGWG